MHSPVTLQLQKKKKKEKKRKKRNLLSLLKKYAIQKSVFKILVTLFTLKILS